MAKHTLQLSSTHTGGSGAPSDSFQFCVNRNQTLGHSRALEAVIGFTARERRLCAYWLFVPFFWRNACFKQKKKKTSRKKQETGVHISQEVQGSGCNQSRDMSPTVFSSCDKPRALHYVLHAPIREESWSSTSEDTTAKDEPPLAPPGH